MLSREFLINEGKCCGNRCRLCPYEPKYMKGSTNIKMKREDILIVCALEQETNNELDEWNVIYTGCGKVNATYELTAELFFSKSMTGKLTNLPKLVINFGTAGSKDIPIHTLVDCNKFVQRDMDASGLGFKKGETPFDNHPQIIDYSYVKNPIGKNYVCGAGDSFTAMLATQDWSYDVGEVLYKCNLWAGLSTETKGATPPSFDLFKERYEER